MKHNRTYKKVEPSLGENKRDGSFLWGATIKTSNQRYFEVPNGTKM